jgi:hypothetical protein
MADKAVTIDTGATEDTALQLHVKNHGGTHCERALNTIITYCDLPGLTAWRSVSGNELGNSFFTTVHAATNLISAGFIDNIYVVTGLFEHADLAEPVPHAWLEFRKETPHAVVNVAHLPERPLYAMHQRDFYAINQCRKRIQEIPLKRLRIKAQQMSERNQRAGGGVEIDIRALTLKALAPTLKKLTERQKAPAR